MDGTSFNKALKAGKKLYGMMLVSRSPKYAEAIAALGMDFIFIDTEHIDIDRTTLSWMCRTYSALDIAPLVRIPSPDPYTASATLDGGAEGIIAPYIESVDEVKALVGAVKYKPLKGEKLRRILEGEENPEPELAEYLIKANKSKSLIVNIESVPAMEALDEILKIPGLDGILIGPHDLSCSLGIPEEYKNPIYDQAVREILTKGRAANVGAGIHVHYPSGVDDEIAWCKETCANLIVHQSDILTFSIAMKKDLETLRYGIEGDKEHANGEGEISINI